MMLKIDKEEMIKGYIEMSDINLSISEEFFNAENQNMLLGDAIYELDKKSTKGNSE